MPDIVNEAMKMAIAAHDGQFYNKQPYSDHCARVVRNLRELGITEPAYLAVGWLHDVVEDTKVTLDDIQLQFGSEVASGVDAMTRRDLPSGKEPEHEYMERVMNNSIAFVVKWCDMSDNLLHTMDRAAAPAKRHLWDRYIWRMRFMQESIDL